MAIDPTVAAGAAARTGRGAAATLPIRVPAAAVRGPRSAPGRRPRNRLGLILCCALTGVSFTGARPVHSGEMPVSSSSASSGAASAAPDRSARTSLQDPSGAAVEVEFAYRADRRSVQVRYSVRNSDPRTALAVFDRGGTHEVRSGRHALGAIAAPTVTDADGDVELRHAALPLPDPAPYAPSRPIAIKLAPGASLAGRFEFALPGAAAPKRLRWCLGVMAFDAGVFDPPRATDYGDVSAATFAAADRQRLLCTPWFVVATQAFEP